MQRDGLPVSASAPDMARSIVAEFPALPARNVPPPRPAAIELAAARQRKVTAGGPKGLRHKWLRLDSEGDTLVLTAGKHHLIARLGVQARDLRLLDAAPASSPPAVLAREKSIIVNLEFIKCIITSDYCLIMDSGESRVAAFVEELRRRLRGTDGTGSISLLDEGTGEVGEAAAFLQRAFGIAGSEVAPSDAASRPSSEGGDSPRSTRSFQHASELSGHLARRHILVGRLQLSDIVEEMPFEMRALEAALDFVRTAQ
mmetsp:Transcript_7680/g.22738  ORF Transcript_7680/g.22738 Transcript_7680/m.22738 type:complete len:257 (-) Transcript_7680:1376-2146(-)